MRYIMGLIRFCSMEIIIDVNIYTHLLLFRCIVVFLTPYVYTTTNSID